MHHLGPMVVFGVRLLGLSWENLHKLLLTVGFVAAALLIRRATLRLLRWGTRKRPNPRLLFWTRQATSLLAALLIGLAFVSIWFDDPSRMATPVGIVTAGIAFALQKVITAFAAYVVIMRGRTFSVGDRIVMGGVRGNVIELGFIQTAILEMGDPQAGESTQHDSPSTWVHARQYTGRVVTVTNDKVFDSPVYNFTREFPFIWEELRVPVPYKCDRARAERILLEAAREETLHVQRLTQGEREQLARRYFVDVDQDDPRVYWRITDNWLELTVRFVCRPYDVRGLKDRMSRRILAGFDEARIAVASSTFDVVGLPALRVEGEPAAVRRDPDGAASRRPA
jgi:small-conductance mechanosensitive channel